MNYQQLLDSLSRLNSESFKRTIQVINFVLTLRNWLVGRFICEYEQKGEDRSQYGDRLLKKLSRDLAEVGKGFSERNLKKMRLFYQTYPLKELSSMDGLSIKELTSTKFLDQSLFALFQEGEKEEGAYFIKLCQNLSWSHFVELIRLEDEMERSFYEVETLQNKWSVREMKRQIDSQLFSRLCLSKEREELLKLAQKGQVIDSPQDLIKDPYIFEFLNLPEDRSFTESELEKAIIDNLQSFLLEMGKGFCFVARQKRITFNTKHYYIDLLLYNRKLKSLIAVDLKIGEFDHGDAGQMNFYLGYLKKEEREDGENPPIGIILCASRDEAFVEFALDGIQNSLFVSQYKLVLPSKGELKNLIEKAKEETLGLPIEIRGKSTKELPFPSRDTLLSMPISDLGLSKRSNRCMDILGISTLGELVQKTEEELLKVRNFGKKSLQEVKLKLSEFELSLEWKGEPSFA